MLLRIYLLGDISVADVFGPLIRGCASCSNFLIVICNCNYLMITFYE